MTARSWRIYSSRSSHAAEPVKATGLGLSISHRIISQHGGEIEAPAPAPARKRFHRPPSLEPPATSKKAIGSLDPETEFLKMSADSGRRRDKVTGDKEVNECGKVA